MNSLYGRSATVTHCLYFFSLSSLQTSKSYPLVCHAAFLVCADIIYSTINSVLRICFFCAWADPHAARRTKG